MAEQEAADLNAGRVRLADLDSDDDYDYGGKRGNKKKGRKKGKSKTGNNDVVQNEEDAGSDRDTASVTDTNDAVEENNDDGDGDFGEKKIDKTFDGGAIVDKVCNGVENIDKSCTRHDSSEEVEEEPDSWRCECCRKEFKSHKQFENHERSKKHKDTLKRYETKFQKEALRDMMDEFEE